MANIKSQKKRNRQNEQRHERNKAFRSELKTRYKHTIEAAEAGDKARAEELLRFAQRRIDMATSRGILTKNTAARRKSRLTRQVNALVG